MHIFVIFTKKIEPTIVMKKFFHFYANELDALAHVVKDRKAVKTIDSYTVAGFLENPRSGIGPK